MSKDQPIVTTTRALEQMVYHAVMEFSPWPMAEVEGTAHVVQAINPAFCALLEKTEEEVLGKPLAELFSEDHATQGLLDRVLNTGEAATHVETGIDTPGPKYWSYTCWPVQAKDARHVGLMIQVSETTVADRQTREVNEALLVSAVQQHELADVADKLNVRLHDEMVERQKVEETVREIDAQLRLALDSAELGTWALDTRTGLFRSDERYQTIFGVAVTGLNEKQAIDNIHPDDRARVQLAVTAAIRPEDPAPYAIEYRVVHADGTTHWVYAKGRAKFSDEGQPRKLTDFAGTVADITERKQLELVVEQTAKDLAEMDRRKSEFLATLAHELRNPLAPLRNGLELLSMSDHDGATWDQAHGMMGRQLDQMVRLIEELMDLSRISRGTVDLRMEQVDLRTVLEQAVETSLPLIERQEHTFLLDLPNEPVPVQADTMRLTQVFTNLLNNAAKYTDHGGSIAVHAEMGEKEVIVTVDDNGIGIAPDQLGRVFDMFAQVERANDRVQGGLGIGLNIVKHLVGMHGGQISVSSDGLGAGSSFMVRLPLATGQEAKEQEAGPGVETTATAPHRILIVDDNEDAANMMAMLLGKFDHEVRVAHNGMEALEIGAQMLPQLILMDLGMPVMDGYAACRAIRKTPWGATLPIIALSGWGQPEDRIKTRDAGFDAHLVKPITRATLLATLASLEKRVRGN